MGEPAIMWQRHAALFGPALTRQLGNFVLTAGIAPVGRRFLSFVEAQDDERVVYCRERPFATLVEARTDLDGQLSYLETLDPDQFIVFATSVSAWPELDGESYVVRYRPIRRAEVGNEGELDPFGKQLQSEVPGSEVELRVKPLNQGRRIVDLENLFVPKERRNEGVGSSFMERAVQWADANNVWLTLSVADKNRERGTTSRGRLIQFYKQFGFVENRGRHKDYSLSLYTSMYRPPRGKGAAEEESGEFDTHGPDSIGDPLPQSHYLSHRLASVTVEHYSANPHLRKVDPAYYGAGISGAERRRKANDPHHWVDRAYFYDAGSPPETDLAGQYKYTAILPANAQIYDMGQDHDHLAEISLNESGVGVNLSIFERRIKEGGYFGFRNTSGAMPYALGIFYPVAVEPASDEVV